MSNRISSPLNLKTAVEQSKIPFALSMSKGGRDFGLLTKWVSVWKPFMLRQAQHERLPHASTAVFRLKNPGVRWLYFGLPLLAMLLWGSAQAAYPLHSTSNGGWGGSHITTVDGVNYDFQSAGEFIALRGDGLIIQARQTPIATTPPPSGANAYTGISSCVSVYTAFAAEVGTHRVTYQPNFIRDPQTQTLTQDSRGMQLRVDGVLTTLGPDGICLGPDPTSSIRFSCGCMGMVKSAAGNGIEIHFPNKTRLIVTSTWWAGQKKWFLNLNLSGTAATEGIMGRIAPGSWLPALPGGTSAGPKPTALHDRYVALNETFADAWRVTDATSLFDYDQGTSAASFTLDEWPRENPTACTIAGEPAAQSTTRAVATASCKKITDKYRKANCEFDVMATGNTGFADSYLLAQQLESGRTETTLRDDRDPTKYGESVTFTAIVAPEVSRSGVGNPTGSVQFVLDKIITGSPIALDPTGQATWTTSNLPAINHRIQAKYIPSSGSIFKASTSPEESHTVTATPQQWLWFFITAVAAVIGLLVRWFRQKKAP